VGSNGQGVFDPGQDAVPGVSIRSYTTFDDIDRRIVVALQRDGRASWRAIADAVGASTATVARRGQQLISSGLVKVAIVPTLGSNGPVDSFLIRINCEPGTQLQVAAELTTHENTRFVSLVTGGYDIMAELVVNGGATQYPHLIEELQSISGVARWRSDFIMHVYKVSLDWGRQLFADTITLDEGAGDESAPAEPHVCDPSHFDVADRSIVDALREDGRVTFQSVADQLGMNESSVRRRFERLRSTGCVDSLTLVPAPAMGMGAETLLTITVDPRSLEDVAAKLARHPSVRYLSAILDDSALFCEVILPSTADLYPFITSTLSRLEGVQGWNASMELLYLKRGFVETPWWRTDIHRRPEPEIESRPYS
jgi:DNA-binding Lrp family transcriptional regulator